jgi:hypothetical protein
MLFCHFAAFERKPENNQQLSNKSLLPVAEVMQCIAVARCCRIGPRCSTTTSPGSIHIMSTLVTERGSSTNDAKQPNAAAQKSRSDLKACCIAFNDCDYSTMVRLVKLRALTQNIHCIPFGYIVGSHGTHQTYNLQDVSVAWMQQAQKCKFRRTN